MATTAAFVKTMLNQDRVVIGNINILNQERTKWNTTYDQPYSVVDVRPYVVDQCRCPVCMQKCSIYDHAAKDPVHWRAQNLCGMPVYLLYRPARIYCPEHGVLTEYIPWADGNSRFTPEFNNEVAWMATRMSKSAIAVYLGIDWRTVGNCVNAALMRIEPYPENRLVGVERICVDETAYKKGHKYITVVYNMDKNHVIWVGEGHGRSVFEKFCLELTEEQRDAIVTVAGDGAKWIDSCTADYFKNAHRCVDPFHVTEWALDAVNEVRADAVKKARKEASDLEKQFKKENSERTTDTTEESTAACQYTTSDVTVAQSSDVVNTSNDEKCDVEAQVSVQKKKDGYTAEQKQQLDIAKENYKKIKGARYALGKNPENRTESQDDRIAFIAESFPDVYDAYKLKENLRHILHMENAEAAEIELSEWIMQARESNLPPMVKLADKIVRNQDGIINSIRYKANSAKSEACNASIKNLIYTARGFQNVNNLKALVYLKCSDLVVLLTNRVQMSAEQAATYREYANMKRVARQQLLKNVGAV